MLLKLVLYMENNIKKDFECFKDELKYLEEYRKKLCCTNCGAPLSSDVCKWCRTEIKDETKKEEINYVVSRLSIIINSIPNEVYFNETLNYLYIMLDVEVISKYFAKLDYQTIIENEKNRIKTLLEEGNGLTESDSKNFEFIYLHCCNSLEKEKYAILVLRERILKRSEFSLLFFEKTMLNFINLVCKNENLHPLSYGVAIRDIDNARGRVVNDILMQIDRKEIKNLYYKADLDTIVTIYHEVRHLLQVQDFKNYRVPNIQTFTMLKEDIVSSYSDYYHQEYYKFNYNKISFELDAQYFGISSAEKLINTLGISISEEAKKKISAELEKILTDKNDETRIIEGIEYTVEGFFDEFIVDKPELLESYPYLKYQYITDDGETVRNKTQQELVQQLMSFNFDGMNQTEIINTQFFLTQLIQSKGQKMETETAVINK